MSENSETVMLEVIDLHYLILFVFQSLNPSQYVHGHKTWHDVY
jgi:hypothetical protein